jgi:4'-phosphopantetheinyl transferase EntD
VIGELLPSPVVAVEAFADPPELELYPAEEEHVARAVDKRRREFATVRRCAREALGRLGVPPGPILPGERGAPTWPAGIVGSMTHCAGYRGAAVAREEAVQALGLDAEPHDRLPDGVLEVVTLPAERERLATLSNDVHWDRLLFSAKESIYKAWYPLARRWLGFEEADVTLDPAGTFTARLLVPGPVSGFTGRWTVHNGLLGTAIAVLR